jgi:hypothetical protein
MLQPRSLPTGPNGADLQEQRASPISANTEPTIARLLHNPQLALLAEPTFTFTSSTIELSQQHVSRHELSKRSYGSVARPREIADASN